MKLAHCFLAIAMACGLTGAAKADTLDFHMVVLDPPSAPGFTTVPIFTTPFTITFSACAPGQLPTNTLGTYEGCFSGVNRTGNDWTGLDLTFDNTEFPEISVSVVVATPEPDSIWLMATGLFLMGLYFANRRGLIGSTSHL